MSSGTITPVTPNPGSGAFLGIVPPLERTHLSLDRYAKILGISPVHFWQGFGQDIWFIDAGCDDVWPRHSWQKADAVSREELAITIRDAEEQLKRFVNFPVAPEWFDQETHRYPNFYRPEYSSTGLGRVDGLAKSIETSWQKVNRVGRRATTSISEGVTVSYTDEDADGFFETATITVNTTLLDNREIKVYFAGTNADPRWEVRDVRSIVANGTTAIIKLDSWLLISPELKAAYPTPSGFRAVDIGDSTTNFVSTVDVYREYTDDTIVSAELYWESVPSGSTNLPFSSACPTCSGSGCAACSLTRQDGCLHVRDHQAGIVVPMAATYDADSGSWNQSTLSVCRSPDQVRIWYQAGDVADQYLNGYTLDPLSDFWAQTIAMLATARLERSFCGCGNTVALANHWRTDIAFSGEDTSFLVDFGMLANPFGTKAGEIQAWNRVRSFHERRFDAALI